MYATGESAEQALKDTVEKSKGKFIMVYEGSVMTGFDGNALRIAGKPSLEQIKEVAPNAAAIIAVGSCAVDGGWVKAYPNPARRHGYQRVPQDEGHRDPGHQPADLPGQPGVDRRDGRRRAAPRQARERRASSRSSTSSAVRSSSSARRSTTTARAAATSRTASSSTSSAPPKRRRATACTRSAARARRRTRTARSSAGTTRSRWCVESGSPCIGCGGFNWVDENAPFLNRFRHIGIGRVSIRSGGCNPANDRGASPAPSSPARSSSTASA